MFQLSCTVRFSVKWFLPARRDLHSEDPKVLEVPEDSEDSGSLSPGSRENINPTAGI